LTIDLWTFDRRQEPESGRNKRLAAAKMNPYSEQTIISMSFQ
jgi:hypothetical protein